MVNGSVQLWELCPAIRASKNFKGIEDFDAQSDAIGESGLELVATLRPVNTVRTTDHTVAIT